MWNLLAEILGIAPTKTKYYLGWRPGLNVTQFRQMEAQTRKVARWAGSPSWRAMIKYVFMDGKADKKTDLGWCTYAPFREGRSRSIWVNSRVNWSEQADTALHEYAHVFVPYREGHGKLFRLVFLVSWGLYFDADDKTFRRHARKTIRRYGSRIFWRTELNEVHNQYIIARSELMT